MQSHPITITPTKNEIANGRLASENLEVAIRSLHRDGLVVVNDVIPHEMLDRLNSKMVKDAYKLYARKENSPFNYTPNNLQQDPPPMREHFESQIFLSKEHIATPLMNLVLRGSIDSISIQITSTALGPRPKWTFCSGNTAMPPTAESPAVSQPVHSDADFQHPDHPFAYVVNVPLITMTPENGSTEIWLGTHQDTNLHFQEGLHGERASGRIKSEKLNKRRAIRPPCQPTVPKGSIVIRDLRLWHAGIGNQTDTVRVMLAMIHFAPWYRNPMKLQLVDDLKEVIEKEQSLEIPVEWASKDAIDAQYLNRAFGNAYDFSQGAGS
ncbi:uncharacterized protein N7459_006064 [Penicillium hispanicum]|uniref:uncharacterized protein n=1 Tax=Penicillium hispanicum TaxID=1080232 RepID=UPI00254068CB|nr:uncharacterized protein N7459_006064 [Penicillium hispanicum]KAJ5580079.1 hypothetical protein N7459_006064 [Penicillium hispanicum]